MDLQEKMLHPQTYSANTKYIEEEMQTDRQSDRQTDSQTDRQMP